MVEQRSVLVCIPADHTPAVPSERRNADCGHDVWISLNVLANVPFDSVMCVPCVVEKVPPGTPFEVPDAVMSEVLEKLDRKGDW